MVCSPPKSTHPNTSHLKGEDAEVDGDARKRPRDRGGGRLVSASDSEADDWPPGFPALHLNVKTTGRANTSLPAVLCGYNSTKAVWTKTHVGKYFWTPDCFLWKHTHPNSQLGRFSKVSLLMATQGDVSSKPKEWKWQNCHGHPERATSEEGKLKWARVNKYLSDPSSSSSPFSYLFFYWSRR